MHVQMHVCSMSAMTLCDCVCWMLLHRAGAVLRSGAQLGRGDSVAVRTVVCARLRACECVSCGCAAPLDTVTFHTRHRLDNPKKSSNRARREASRRPPFLGFGPNLGGALETKEVMCEQNLLTILLYDSGTSST